MRNWIRSHRCDRALKSDQWLIDIPWFFCLFKFPVFLEHVLCNCYKFYFGSVTQLNWNKYPIIFLHNYYRILAQLKFLHTFFESKFCVIDSTKNLFYHLSFRICIWLRLYIRQRYRRRWVRILHSIKSLWHTWGIRSP